MECVEVSARILHWPQCCACCSGPSDTWVEVSYTRYSGVEVIRTQTKSWKVPYCNRCLAHMKASKDLARFGRFIPYLPALLIVAALAAAAAVLPFLIRLPAFVGVLLGSVWVAVVTLGVVALYPPSARAYRGMLHRRERDRQLLEDRLERSLSEGCAEERKLAVEYAGWNGSIHRFYFSSRQFAREFRRANAGKVLG